MFNITLHLDNSHKVFQIDVENVETEEVEFTFQNSLENLSADDEDIFDKVIDLLNSKLNLNLENDYSGAYFNDANNTQMFRVAVA